MPESEPIRIPYSKVKVLRDIEAPTHWLRKGQVRIIPHEWAQDFAGKEAVKIEQEIVTSEDLRQQEYTEVKAVQDEIEKQVRKEQAVMAKASKAAAEA